MTNIMRYRRTPIIVRQISPDEWRVMWSDPETQEVKKSIRATEKEAIAFAKEQIDSFYGPFIHPSVWRRGNDWWSGIEVENGVVPSDAVPWYPDTEES